jgi:MinD-like ATPase involved in chromosome partitioning or flagellar assembly
LGCSTLAINLGISLRMRTKKDVAVAEFRPGEGSLCLDLGYTRPEGLGRLLQKKPKEIGANDVAGELLSHSSGVRLLLPTYQPSDARHIVAAESFEAIAQHLAYQTDYLIIDLGAGLHPITERVLGLCDELIVLLEPIPHTILRTRALMEELIAKGFGEGRLNVVLYHRQRTELQISLANVQEQFKHAISIVFTPAPELVYQAAKNNIPLVVQHPDNLTSQQFAKLAENIVKHVRPKS